MDTAHPTREAADYGGYRQGFGPEFFARLRPHGIARPGQTVLDIGTGTGLFAREFARRGCQVTALDPSASSVAIAAAGNAADVIAVRYLVARAEALPIARAALDLVSAGTCWHLFDRRAAAREALRVLRPGGRLLIAHLDWNPVPGGIAAATQSLFHAHARRAAAAQPATFLYPEWTDTLLDAGFREWESFGFTTTCRYTPTDWRARVRARERGGDAMSPAAAAAFDAALARVLATRFPGDMLEVEHRVFALLARAPSA